MTGLRISLLLLLALFWGCNNNDDDNENFVSPPELRFYANYDSEPLVILDQSYEYEDNQKLRLQLFQFFISNVRLVDTEGNLTEPLIDVAQVSFANNLNQEHLQKVVLVWF